LIIARTRDEWMDMLLFAGAGFGIFFWKRSL